MGLSTKSQFYRYSARTVCVTNVTFCTKRILMEIVPPDNALSIENLFCHVRINFDNALPSGDKVLHRIGIISDRPAYSTQSDVQYFRYIDIDKAAVADIVDLRIDLSSLLKSDNIGTVGTIGDATDGDSTLVYLETANAGLTTSDADAGTIELWKLDGIYTTKEIR